MKDIDGTLKTRSPLRQEIKPVDAISPQEPAKEENEKKEPDTKYVIHKQLNFRAEANLIKKYKVIAIEKDIDVQDLYQAALEKYIEYLESQQID